MQLVKTKLTVGGMVCTGCASRIENTLDRLEGVQEANANDNSGTVTVSYDAQKISIADVIQTIRLMGYTVKSEESAMTVSHEENRKERKGKALTMVAGLIIVGLAVFLMFNNTLWLSFLPEIDASMGYGILFIVGLLTSVHCIAMCGGINLSQCIGHHIDEGQPFKAKIWPSLLYNMGRVIAYTVIGGIVGALGSAISFSGAAKGIVAIAAGLFMMIMGLNMTGLFPWIRKLAPHMPRIFGKNMRNKNRGPFIVGLLNGLMPCGPLQAMQIYALGTGGFFAGALSMLMFGLGTVPLMFGFGALSSLLSGKLTRRLMKISAMLVIALGAVMLGRGLTQSGLTTVLASDNSRSRIAQVQQDVQLVSTTMKANVYDPITVKAGIPVKWTITADADALNGCNNPVTIPEYAIQTKMTPGDNVIEFTPEKEGDIVYTCWMGMISGVIHVVSDGGGSAGTQAVQSSDSPSSDSVPAENEDDGWDPFGGYEDFQWENIGAGCCNGSYGADFENGKFPADNAAVAEIRDGVQYVSITVNESGFVPALVVMQKEIKTEWTINAEQLNGCNDSLIFSHHIAPLGLKKGENRIEFTPTEDFSYSCWMGMLNGYVKVVDDINNFDLAAIQQEAAEYEAPSGAGCCG